MQDYRNLRVWQKAHHLTRGRSIFCNTKTSDVACAIS